MLVFTPDHNITSDMRGEFCVVKPNIKMEESGSILAVQRSASSLSNTCWLT